MDLIIIALFILGFILGFFLWANILGTLFGTIPISSKLIKQGLIKKEGYSLPKMIAPILLPIIIFTLSFFYFKPFLYGSIISFVFMLFSLGKLRQEAFENILAKESHLDSTFKASKKSKKAKGKKK